ncbi:hypothetical protein ACQPZJ_37655 [Actinoplanes sp. CA-054009]
MLETVVVVGVMAVGFGWVIRSRGRLRRVAWVAAGGLALMAVAAVVDVVWLLFTLRLAEGDLSDAGVLTYVRWNSTIGTATAFASAGGMVALAGSLFLRPGRVTA